MQREEKQRILLQFCFLFPFCISIFSIKHKKERKTKEASPFYIFHPLATKTKKSKESWYSTFSYSPCQGNTKQEAKSKEPVCSPPLCFQVGTNEQKKKQGIRLFHVFFSRFEDKKESSCSTFSFSLKFANKQQEKNGRTVQEKGSLLFCASHFQRQRRKRRGK